VLSLVGLLLLMVVVHDVSLKVAARDQGTACGMRRGAGWVAQSLASKTVRRVVGARDCYVSMVWCSWNIEVGSGSSKGDCMYVGQSVERLQLRSDPGTVGDRPSM
jgi:hypothetical protein